MEELKVLVLIVRIVVMVLEIIVLSKTLQCFRLNLSDGN
jgi:hypothetical protein